MLENHQKNPGFRAKDKVKSNEIFSRKKNFFDVKLFWKQEKLFLELCSGIEIAYSIKKTR